MKSLFLYSLVIVSLVYGVYGTQVFAVTAVPPAQSANTLQPLPIDVRPNISGNVNNTGAPTGEAPGSAANGANPTSQNLSGSQDDQSLVSDSSLDTLKRIMFFVVVIIVVCILFAWKRKA